MMRKMYLLLGGVIMAFQLAAQSPQAIKYQAIARTGDGEPITNKNITVKIDLLDENPTGTVLYSELHKVQTNAYGLFNIGIGKGAELKGKFNQIPWATGDKWIGIAVDPDGGNNYIEMGASQIMAVPFAMYAERAGNVNLNDTSATNELLSSVLFDPALEQLTIAEGSHISTVAVPVNNDDLTDNSINDLNNVNAIPTAGQILKWDGSQWIAADEQQSAAQQLTMISTAIAISGGNSVDLSPFLDNTDEQQLTFDPSTNTLHLSNGGTVDLSSLMNNTDVDPANELQDIELVGNDLSLTGSGVTVTLPVMSGPTGPQGTRGLPGADGIDGQDGAIGPQGVPGIDGAIGPQGPQGIPGNDGQDGVQGLQGLQGIQGVAGPTGPQGAQGLQGIQGLAGNDGADGAVGPQGPQGLQGIQGVAGPIGPQGLQGLQGVAGPTGPQGLQGPAGTANLNGTTNYLARYTTNGTTVGNSAIYDDGVNIGIGTASPINPVEITSAKSTTLHVSNTLSNGTGIVVIGNNVSPMQLNAGSAISGTGTEFGMTGFATNTQTAAFGGYFWNDGIYSYVGGWGLSGNVFTPYKIIGNGVVSTVVKDVDNKPVTMFAPEAPEVLFQDYGVGELVNGHAVINIDPSFSKNILVDKDHPIKIFIQPEGDCKGVYVSNKSANGFEVNELNGGKSSISFSWSVIATRKNEVYQSGNGQEKVARFDVRFPAAPEQAAEK